MPAQKSNRAGYRWDVFLSYPRRPDVRRWVAEVLKPQVDESLQNAGIGRPVTVFRDEPEIEAGSIWPQTLSDVHARSRVILAVLCYAYFESRWGCSEWKTAESRDAPGAAMSVIVPVRFNDLEADTFDALRPTSWITSIQARQARNLYAYSQLVNRLSDTELAFQFRQKIADLCLKSLKPRILAAPKWDKDWPKLPQHPLSKLRRRSGLVWENDDEATWTSHDVLFLQRRCRPHVPAGQCCLAARAMGTARPVPRLGSGSAGPLSLSRCGCASTRRCARSRAPVETKRTFAELARSLPEGEWPVERRRRTAINRSRAPRR